MLYFSLLIALCCSLTSYASEPVIQSNKEVNADINPFQAANPLSHLAGDPQTVIGNCVSIVTGDFTEIQVDLKVGGLEELAIQRFYASTDKEADEPFKAWKSNHDITVHHPQRSTKSDLILQDAFGANLPFKRKKNNEQCTWYEVHPDIFKYRVMSSTSPHQGRYQLNNRTALRSKKDAILITKEGTGQTYYFEKPSGLHHLPIKRLVKPNGNALHYAYDQRKNLIQVTQINRQGTYLNQLNFKKTYTEVGTQCQIQITDDQHNQVTYQLAKLPSKPHKRWFLSQVERTQGISETYQYDEQEGKLISKQGPDGRFLNIEYYDLGKKAKKFAPYTKFKSEQGRVKKLKAPLGKDATPLTAYRFNYIFADYEGKKDTSYLALTSVLDAHQNLTRYYLNPHERLKAIERFTGQGKQSQLYSREEFFRGKKGTPAVSQLQAKVLRDAKGQALCCHTYAYDEAGRISAHCLHGNLTGANTNLTVDHKGQPTGGDSLYLGYEYTADTRHLLQYENHPTHNHDYRYVYHADTDLLQAKYTIDGTTIRLREFFTYDDQGALLTHIIDNGLSFESHDLNGVTERKIERRRNCAAFPQHLPEEKAFYYVDQQTGEEQLLKKSFYTYDQQGHCIKEAVYDSQLTLRYQLEWVYNAQGKIIQQRDALGHLTTYCYDANQNRIAEEDATGRIYSYTYDLMNRLIRKKQKGPEGCCLTESFRYDLVGNKIASVDSYGQETLYAYDEFNRLIQKIEPAIQQAAGPALHPIITYTYDTLGHLTSITDANGNQKKLLCNLRGQTYDTRYPDGSKESQFYSLKGHLLKSIARDGSYTTYTYDYLSRLLESKTYGTDHTLLKESSRHYDAFHLLAETDENGIQTRYQYDGAGRVSSVEKGLQRTTYVYDTLGYCIETRQHLENDQYLSQQSVYDVKGRVIEESQRDQQGTLYAQCWMTYDAHDSLLTKTSTRQAGFATKSYQYNSRGEPVLITDALGHQTHYHYHQPHTNCIEEINSLGIRSLTTKDGHNRVILVERKNSLGDLLAQTQHFYDGNGNLVKQQETVVALGAIQRLITTCWSYDSLNRLIQLTEAAGTPEQKVTTYQYNSQGQVTAKTRAGLTLASTYNEAGYLKAVTASDDSLHEQYNYDARHNLIAVQDCKLNQSTQRTYDPYNRLITETLANGLCCQFTYDPLNRLKTFTLPDQSAIHYCYQGPNLTKIERYAHGTCLYAHHYTSYDLDGQLTAETLSGQAGQVTYAHDLLGQCQALQAPHFQEQILQRDGLGQLLKRQIQDAKGVVDYVYTYDNLAQLTTESGLLDHTFVNDSISNHLSCNEQPQTVNNLNQLLTQQDIQLTYDAQGNRQLKATAQQNVQYGYNSRQQLTSVQTATTKTCYTYDAFDRRLTKTVYLLEDNQAASTTVRYLYCKQQEIGSCDANGQLLELRVLAPGQRAIAIELQGTPYVPTYDHLGHTTSLLQLDGSLYESYRYTGFGTEQLFDATGQAISTSLNPWRYASQHFENETNLIHFGFRYYDPTTRVWLTPDPAGFVDGINLYAYVHHNPLRYRDPDGRFAYAIPLIMVSFGVFEVSISTLTVSAVSAGVLALGYNCGMELANNYISSRTDPHVPPSFELPGFMYPALGAAGWICTSTISMSSSTTGADSIPEPTAKPDTETKKKNPRANMDPDPAAEGDHTTIKRDPVTGKIKNYETFRPQSNPRNPNPWETVKRYDNIGEGHHNKHFDQKINNPHIHDKGWPGGIREPQPWELPRIY